MDNERMPCWYYDKEELKATPSYQDGISDEDEKKLRAEGARFIVDLSKLLKLSYDTFATAIVFFHRFYMFHSFKKSPRYITAACCLMLAGKVEETPKKARDIISHSRNLLHSSEFVLFGSNPRETLICFERVLLKTIKFDLHIKHPYTFLTKFAKMIKCSPDQKVHLQATVQNAWGLINDSLSTTLCLQWEPEIIGCSVLYLATKINKFKIEDWEGKVSRKKWWDCFVDGLTPEVMDDISHKILDVYSQDQNSDFTVESSHKLD